MLVVGSRRATALGEEGLDLVVGIGELLASADDAATDDPQSARVLALTALVLLLVNARGRLLLDGVEIVSAVGTRGGFGGHADGQHGVTRVVLHLGLLGRVRHVGILRKPRPELAVRLLGVRLGVVALLDEVVVLLHRQGLHLARLLRLRVKVLVRLVVGTQGRRRVHPHLTLHRLRLRGLVPVELLFCVALLLELHVAVFVFLGIDHAAQIHGLVVALGVDDCAGLGSRGQWQQKALVVHAVDVKTLVVLFQGLLLSLGNAA